MFRHLLYCGWCASSRISHPGVVKQNDVMIRCEAVRNRRVPAIHVGVEVLQKKKRSLACPTETAVGVTNTIGLNELCRNRIVCVGAHMCSLANQICRIPANLTRKPLGIKPRM